LTDNPNDVICLDSSEYIPIDGNSSIQSFATADLFSNNEISNSEVFYRGIWDTTSHWSNKASRYTALRPLCLGD